MKEKVLNVNVTEEYLQEVREGVTNVCRIDAEPPLHEKLLCVKDEEIELDEQGLAIPIRYNKLRLVSPNDSLLVDINEITTELICEPMVSNSGELIKFKTDENGDVIFFKYEDGKFVIDDEGYYIEDEDGEPMEAIEGETWDYLYEPIVFEKGDKRMNLYGVFFNFNPK